MAALRGHFVNKLDYNKLVLIDAVAVLPSGSPFFLHVGEHADAFTTLPDFAHRAFFEAYIQQAAFHTLSDAAKAVYLDGESAILVRKPRYQQLDVTALIRGGQRGNPVLPTLRQARSQFD